MCDIDVPIHNAIVTDPAGIDCSPSPAPDHTLCLPSPQQHGVRTRLQNNISQPKQFTDGAIKYSIRGRKAFSTEVIEPSSHLD